MEFKKNQIVSIYTCLCLGNQRLCEGCSIFPSRMSPKSMRRHAVHPVSAELSQELSLSFLRGDFTC